MATKIKRQRLPHVHTATPPRPETYRTWSKLLDRIRSGDPFDPVEEGQVRLRCWIHDLVMKPKSAQSTLLVIGPACSGKRTFNQALGLLLPDKAVLKYPPTNFDLKREEWNTLLKTAWLMVIESRAERFVNLFGHRQSKNGRFLKWLLTDTQPVNRDLPNVQRFKVDLLTTTAPAVDLLRRLEDEKDSFRSSLLQYGF